MSRNSLAKQRSLSKSRSSQSVNGETIDSKTKQTIFLKTTVCSVAKQIRSSEDAFQEPLIGKLLAGQLRKRHAHGAEVICLEDRLHFKKTKVFSKAPFRNWVLYSEIEHYFVFPGHDTLFMLVIKSDMPGKSLFETYKCKTADETNRLRRLVCQACTDPMKKLRHTTDNNRPVSTVSEVSLHEHAISQVNLHEGGNGTVEDDECALSDHHDSSDESDREDVFPVVVRSPEHATLVCSASSPPPPPLKFAPPTPSPPPPPTLGYQDSDIRELSPISFVESNVELKEAHPMLNKAPSFQEFEENDGDGMTYFQYNAKDGAVLNSEGPIFMYLRRFATEYKNGHG